jgi:hypothetical protein
MLLDQFRMLRAAQLDVVMQPLKDVRHVEIVIRHARPVGDDIRDECAVWLVEVDLPKQQQQHTSAWYGFHQGKLI